MRTLRFHSFFITFCAVIALGTSACLDKKKTVTTKSSASSSSSSTIFTGATSATNLPVDGLSIQVSWNQAPSPYTSYTVYAVQPDGSKTALRSLIPNAQLSYVQTGLTSGNIYSFIVRAVKNDGTDDGNNNIVSTLAYAGINKVNGATGISLNSAFINFTAVGSRAQGYRIYCVNPNGAVSFTSSIYNTTDIQKQITGLYSGTTYNCQVNAIYTDFWGNVVNDNNAVTYSFQTISQSFTRAPTPAFKNVMLVQAYGDAPTAPVAATAPAAIPSPVAGITTRRVNITWNSFDISDPMNAQYRVVRVREGNPIDMNATATCTSTTTTSCQVCVSTTAVNALTRTCTDNVTNIGKSPSRYDYAVSLIVEPTSIPPLAEELPKTADARFRILVPIPPDNMVLVHRDSVNYEMCKYMGRDPDPQNHNRCSYTGLGAIPYSTNAFGVETPLTLSGNAGTPFYGVTNIGDFYDFGYNLFIDRWEAGCNWSPSAATSTGGTGMCGAGATPGDCFGLVAPLASQGVDGNVFYQTDNDRCFLKIAGAWTHLGVVPASTAPALLDAAMTSVPSMTVQRMPIANAVNGPANQYCSAKMDPNYGQKRLLFRREFVAAAGFPWLPGEPGQMSDFEIFSMGRGTNHPTSLVCNSFNHNGVAAAGVYNSLEHSPPGTAANYAFMIGSHYTAKCVSRFGAQDMIGNTYEHNMDRFSCVIGSHTCTGATRDLTHYQTYNLDGIASNTGPGGTGNGQIGPNYTDRFMLSSKVWGVSYLSAPMGLPFLGNNAGNAINIDDLPMHDANVSMEPYTEDVNTTRYLMSGGSYGLGVGTTNGRFNFRSGGYGGTNPWGFRCALPAE